jgi:hypothetical protein
MGELSGEAVGIVCDHEVEGAGPRGIAQQRELRTLQVGAGIAVVDILRHDLPPAFDGELPERTHLGVEAILPDLLLGADAGVQGDSQASAPSVHRYSRARLSRSAASSGGSDGIHTHVSSSSWAVRLGRRAPPARERTARRAR